MEYFPATALWITGIICLPIFILGLVMLFTGKGSIFIAGYNTMSNEEKTRWNAPTLSRFIGGIVSSFTMLLFIGFVFFGNK